MTDQEQTIYQAKAELETIVDMMERHNATPEDERSDILREIYEHPLEVSVRCTTFVPVGAPLVADEYRILLMTGGPAIQITGEIADDEPISAKLQYQDWFTPWGNYPLNQQEQATLLDFALIIAPQL